MNVIVADADTANAASVMKYHCDDDEFAPSNTADINSVMAPPAPTQYVPGNQVVLISVVIVVHGIARIAVTADVALLIHAVCAVLEPDGVAPTDDSMLEPLFSVGFVDEMVSLNPIVPFSDEPPDPNVSTPPDEMMNASQAPMSDATVATTGVY